MIHRFLIIYTEFYIHGLFNNLQPVETLVFHSEKVTFRYMGYKRSCTS